MIPIRMNNKYDLCFCVRLYYVGDLSFAIAFISYTISCTKIQTLKRATAERVLARLKTMPGYESLRVIEKPTNSVRVISIPKDIHINPILQAIGSKFICTTDVCLVWTQALESGIIYELLAKLEYPTQ